MVKKHPSREECLTMLKEYDTPDHVIRHCEAVADTALKIAGALVEKGLCFDMQLIRAAGLLHDIARVEKRHWISGAVFARKSGYKEEAAIIKKHMNHTFKTDPAKLKELDLVCLGDRLILEDKYVGVDARMEYLIKKINADERTIKFIMAKKEITRTLVNNIERLIGKTIDELI
jgi:putative nucleotidyltransferase with HDIG domain